MCVCVCVCMLFVVMSTCCLCGAGFQTVHRASLSYHQRSALKRTVALESHFQIHQVPSSGQPMGKLSTPRLDKSDMSDARRLLMLVTRGYHWPSASGQWWLSGSPLEPTASKYSGQFSQLASWQRKSSDSCACAIALLR